MLSFFCKHSRTTRSTAVRTRWAAPRQQHSTSASGQARNKSSGSSRATLAAAGAGGFLMGCCAPFLSLLAGQKDNTGKRASCHRCRHAVQHLAE